MDYGWLRHLIPALAGGIASAVILQFVYRGGKTLKPIRNANARIYTYTPRARKVMTAIGVVCLLFALIPAVMIPYKYFGPEPCGQPHVRCRNKPLEDGVAGALLFLGFGAGGLICLLDPRRYYAKLDETGITVQGMFTGLRYLLWADAEKLVSYPSLQTLAVHGRDAAGKKMRLYVPYSVALRNIIVKLNEQGLFLESQRAHFTAPAEFLEQRGYVHVKPFRLLLPNLTLWKQQGGTQRFNAVLAMQKEDGGLACVESGFDDSALAALQRLKSKMLDALKDSEGAEAVKDVLEQIIEDYKEMSDS